MSIRPILLLGNPLLRTNCVRVKEFGRADLQSLAEDLRETLADFRMRKGFGRGIAAPQIGDMRRVIFTHVDAPLVLVNPVVTGRSRKMMTLWDDCFSFPDLAVKVKRHLSVEVRYQDLEGKNHTLKAHGALAELLQHEIDHVNGVLALDHALDLRHIVYKSEIGKIKIPGAARGM